MPQGAMLFRLFLFQHEILLRHPKRSGANHRFDTESRSDDFVPEFFKGRLVLVRGGPAFQPFEETADGGKCFVIEK
jgi:hypothetical protein